MMDKMSGYLDLNNLSKVACGLNIEGYRPYNNLPIGCKWYNIVQVIDEPLKGDTFDEVISRVKNNNYKYIEEAVGIDIVTMLNQLSVMIEKIKSIHKKILVHVHQYEGTTILHESLELLTGVECITDKTNFYEHPVDYKITHPDIDALISISQCAGFDLPAGTWIVPTRFMDFDVANNIIYTNPITADNHIEQFVDFDYVNGTILVVNGLWNPSVESISHDGVLLIDGDDHKVLSFVQENTKIFDESHDWHHAIKVAYNSTKILNNKHVLYLALLHDVCDHKYPNSIPRSDLSRFIKDNLGSYIVIDGMIDQISFSSQKTFDPVDPILEAVRDGDRLEALGEIGINRCITIVKLRNKIVPDDVIVHCYEKLLRLLPEKYISSESGRRTAIPLHNDIVRYVRTNMSTSKLDTDKYPLPIYI